ncbi:hypothetical protein K8640_02705 [Myxococcus sp. XM-1-1-1]|uniref:hypothetical protein n=1 Tax=Myxococcus sp. XM-1-1-1 TaxID=2874602 RepID=UPI001CBE7016|nr:hypothetical protein [Myxococcus sp. XM-1-1-1]MBZ4407107.1 hypothetical protein [Myxococcus sp. XM-1-1-1]
MVRSDVKVFTNGQYLIGFTSSFRLGQLLQDSFEPQVPEKPGSLVRYMVVDFIDTVRATLEGQGLSVETLRAGVG